MVRNVLSKGTALLLVVVFAAASTIVINSVSSSDQPRENTWVSKAPMPTARTALLAVVDGKIYAIGGNDSGTNEMYDPATDTWTTKAPMPTPRNFFGMAVYENKIYCIGGTRYSGTGLNYVRYTTNEVYDPSTDTWETKAPMVTARWYLQANTVNDKIYLMGGVPNRSINEAYDPVANCYTTKAPIPFAKTDDPQGVGIEAASAVFDDKIYWIGGLNQVYNPNNNSWSLAHGINISPTGAGVTTGEWAPKRIYVFGDGEANFAYDPASDKWDNAHRMLWPRSELGVAVINDTLYVIGGHYFRSSSAANEQYIPLGYGTPDPTYPSPTPSPSPSPSPTPTLSPSPSPIIIIIGLAALAVVIGLLVYFSKHKGFSLKTNSKV